MDAIDYLSAQAKRNFTGFWLEEKLEALEKIKRLDELERQTKEYEATGKLMGRTKLDCSILHENLFAMYYALDMFYDDGETMWLSRLVKKERLADLPDPDKEKILDLEARLREDYLKLFRIVKSWPYNEDTSPFIPPLNGSAHSLYKAFEERLEHRNSIDF